MASTRQMKFAEEIRKHAGNFIAQEANRQSMITPTSVDISPDLKNVTIYVSIYPETSEEMGLHFLKRKRNDFRTFIKQKGYVKVLPFVDFEIDRGEKSRQMMDGLFAKIKDDITADTTESEADME